MPRQRGMLNPDNNQPGLDKLKVIDGATETDFCAHCNNGGGKAAVFSAANSDWQLYEPLKKDYKFVAGMCGDPLKGDQPHMKGGTYYGTGEKVMNYKKGQVIDVELVINAHHNGYSELYMCNLDKCGTDDIDEKCFKEGACEKLMRVESSKCESGDDKGCGPIDEDYPGRWYLPCKSGEPWQFFGGDNGKMQYRLPKDMTCKNCVLQWYWATANSCNPRGMKEYFEGKNKPNWGDCPGDGGSNGGVALGSAECGGEKSPEEFWGCADVTISNDGSAPAGSEAAPLVENKDDGEDKDDDEDKEEEEKSEDKEMSDDGHSHDHGDDEKKEEETEEENDNETSVEDKSGPTPAPDMESDDGEGDEESDADDEESDAGDQEPTEQTATSDDPQPIEEDTEAATDDGSCAKPWNPCGGGPEFNGPKKCCSGECIQINKWISLCEGKKK